MLRSDGLQRWYLLESAGSAGSAQRVAKQLAPSLAADPSTLAAWFEVAQLNAVLTHPACSRVEAWGMHEGAAYLVSEYPAARSLLELSQAIRAAGPKTCAQLVAHTGVLALDALDHVQQQAPLLTHLELDLETVRVRSDGSLTLSELGLWSVLPPGEISRCRFDSGRVQFCAPELVESRATDPRSDLFSLGVLLYQLLTGELPFGGATQLVIAMAIADGKRAPIRDKAPQAPDHLCEIVEVMLSTDADERFQTAGAARAALLSTLRASQSELTAQLGALSAGAQPAPSAVSDRPRSMSAKASVATQMMLSPLRGTAAPAAGAPRTANKTQAIMVPRLPGSQAPTHEDLGSERSAARRPHAELLTQDVPIASSDVRPAEPRPGRAPNDEPAPPPLFVPLAAPSPQLVARAPEGALPPARASVLRSRAQGRASTSVPAAGLPASQHSLETSPVRTAHSMSIASVGGPSAGSASTAPPTPVADVWSERELPVNDGRTMALRAAPVGLSRPLVESAEAVPSQPPMAAAPRAASESAFGDPGYRFEAQLGASPQPSARSFASASSGPPQAGIDSWPARAKAEARGDVWSSGSPPGAASPGASWGAPPMPPQAEAQRESWSAARAGNSQGDRWRDPSDTVFQMKSLRPGRTGTGDKKKSSVLSLLLVSMILGFAAVVGVYFAYRLL